MCSINPANITQRKKNQISESIYIFFAILLLHAEIWRCPAIEETFDIVRFYQDFTVFKNPDSLDSGRQSMRWGPGPRFVRRKARGSLACPRRSN